MQADAMEEPPSILWGLDPIFSAFARLYIQDILQMTESVQIPGKQPRLQPTVTLSGVWWLPSDQLCHLQTDQTKSVAIKVFLD